MSWLEGRRPDVSFFSVGSQPVNYPITLSRLPADAWAPERHTQA